MSDDQKNRPKLPTQKKQAHVHILTTSQPHHETVDSLIQLKNEVTDIMHIRLKWVAIRQVISELGYLNDALIVDR